VHITELGGEYFKFDEARQELRGERTGIRYAIGTRLRVQVSRVDLDGRKIDFRLVREDEEFLARAMKDKGVNGEGAPAKAAAKRAAKKTAGKVAKAPKQVVRAAKKAAARAKAPRKTRR
jgi:ribonuclease R